jgi:hypothetical protein
MKTSLLCWLFFLCTVSICQAQDSQSAQGAPAQSSPVFDSRPHLDFNRLHRDRGDLRFVSPTDNYCAYIRAYRVRQESRGSDAVAPAGYTTCVPAQRFEYRNAIEVQSDSARPTRGDR